MTMESRDWITMAVVIHDWVTGNPNLEEDLKLMRNKADTLSARVADLSTEVKNAELHPGKKLKREVDNWLKNAQELKIRMEGVVEEVEQRVLLNRRRLRDQIRKITKEMGDLLEQATFHNGLTIHDLASSSLPLVTTEMKGRQFEYNLRMTLSWLTVSDEVSKIGLYGVGGVGKTTLAIHIHNQLLSKLGKSASIYWVTVSEKCNMLQLQHKIAKQLNPSVDILEEADEIRRPAILLEAFEKRNNIVVILDDMWEYFSMEEIGLPMRNNKCKLLLTTRSLDVCRRMACQKSVKVEILSKDKSLSFFAEKLGNYDDLSNEAKDIAKLVVKECAGLPLGIKVIATSMRGVFDVFEWMNTLEELKNPTRIHKGMEDKVFRLLQVSYSRLNDKKLQSCFLCCALYPEDYKFNRDELVNLWIMEGHLEEISSRREKLNMAHTMLNRLISACLLDVTGRRKDRVKMHDLIRDMAIEISRQCHYTMVNAGMELQEVPRFQEWTEELRKVSLAQNNIRGLPSDLVLKCPNLSSLLLRENPLEIIPNTFLQFLSSLEFLDLSWTKIKSVPDSVSCLENLSSLKLESCLFLNHVPSLEKLTKLRHLDMRYCYKVNLLPHGMDKLVNLESLLLGRCDRLCVHFRELTSGLSNLQCLELPYGVKDTQVTDLLKLRCLERVTDCLMLDTSNFNTYVQSQNFHRLTSYRIRLALNEHTYLDQCHYDNSIIIESKAFEGGVEYAQLPQNIRALVILLCKFNVISLMDAFPSTNSWESLIILELRHCEGIQYVWVESSSSKPAALENLEELEIHSSSLTGLTEGRVKVPLGVFRNLKTLRMECCHKVEKLFTPWLLNGQLGNLKEIRIASCEGLVEIFEGSEVHEDANIELPKLRVLYLIGLPRLLSICKTGLQVCCKSMEDITVVECPKLRKLPLFHQVFGNEMISAPPPRLRRIHVEKEWWESLVWDDPRIKQVLQPFLYFD